MLARELLFFSTPFMVSLIEGQLNPEERQLLADAILQVAEAPQVVIEVGTWLGGGSTLTFLQSLGKNGTGHLWGVEADHSIYDRMMANLKAHVPDLLHHFTPLFGFSEKVLPEWIATQPLPLRLDVVFLDGGDNPREQMREFEILDPYLPVGARLFAHDAHMRKGKYFVPYLSRLDNWDVCLHDFSDNGLLAARKIATRPSTESARRAKDRVRQIQSSPLEIVARVVPGSLKGFLLRLMPRKLFNRLYRGAN
jgi:hypothetical protein